MGMASLFYWVSVFGTNDLGINGREPDKVTRKTSQTQKSFLIEGKDIVWKHNNHHTNSTPVKVRIVSKEFWRNLYCNI